MPRRRTNPLSRALEQPTRARMLAHISAAETPIPVDALVAAIGLEPAHVRYHVRVLAACGLVELTADGSVTG